MTCCRARRSSCRHANSAAGFAPVNSPASSLTAGYIERLRTIGGRLNAVVTIMEAARARGGARRRPRVERESRSRAAARRAVRRQGSARDARGAPTTWGAEPYKNQVFDYDATVVRELHEAGAVLVAKLAMVELAGGHGLRRSRCAFTGPGITPWNTAFWSGGSSSGPGSAVAAGLVGFAIGAETSGSILTPCGILRRVADCARLTDS